MTTKPPMEGLQLAVNGEWQCPRCGHRSGDDWSQCEGACPVKGSPHYDPRAKLFLPSDWRRAVANEDTVLGYAEWAAAKMEIPY